MEGGFDDGGGDGDDVVDLNGVNRRKASTYIPTNKARRLRRGMMKDESGKL